MLRPVIEAQERKYADLMTAYKEAEADYYDAENNRLAVSEKFDDMLEWAAMYNNADIAAKKMIVSRIIDRVDMYRDYEIKITLNISIEQFLNSIEMVAWVFSFPICIKWGYISYDLRERLNGIQEVSGSIPLISTRRIMKGLISSEIKPFCFPKIHIGMMLAASTAVQASSPSLQKKAVSTLWSCESGLFLLPRNVSHRETRFDYSIFSPFHYLRTIIAWEQIDNADGK